MRRGLKPPLAVKPLYRLSGLPIINRIMIKGATSKHANHPGH